MATTKVKVPEFNSVSKPYRMYIMEIGFWQKITKIEAKEQAVVLAYQLPDDDPSGVKEKLFMEMTLEELSAEDGVQKFTEYMDKLFKKDDLTEAYEDYVEFDSFKRKEGQSITQFLNTFDKLYNVVKKSQTALPQSILAFKLLDAGNLSKQNRMFVLTGIDYEKKDTLYEQTKTALRKFAGEQAGGCGGGSLSSSSSLSAGIKLEPAMNVTSPLNVEESFFTRNKKHWRGGKSRGRGKAPLRSAYDASGKGSRRSVDKPMNPKGDDGEVIECPSCGSYRHLLQKCPHSYENMKKALDGNKDLDEIGLCVNVGLFAFEASNKGVIDSGCSATVAGKDWVNTFLDTMTNEEKARVVRKDSNKSFKFGGGEILKSLQCVEFPCKFGNKNIRLTTEVVDSDIPLLVSSDSLRKAECMLDLANDRICLFGDWVPCDRTSSGLLMISLGKTDEPLPIQKVYLALEGEDTVSKERYLLKLHRQFGHLSENRLKDLLKDAGKWKDGYTAILKKIYSKCETCKRFAKVPARPVCALPVANNFSEVLTMDLKEANISTKYKYILHMIDAYTRYSVSVFLSRKLPQMIVNQVFFRWIAVFERPKRIWTDLGGEFNNEEMKEMSEALGVHLGTGGSHAPWMNGLCERNHQVIDFCLEKILHDNPALNPEIALVWAVNAKNTMKMNSGYSAHQLVFGRNPNLPSVTSDSLPALDGKTTSKAVADHIQSLYQARKAFTESEYSERIRRAIRHNIRSVEKDFRKGDKVYYYKDGHGKFWRGPADVVGCDNSVAWINHQGQLYRVAASRLKHVGDEFMSHSTGVSENPPKQPMAGRNAAAANDNANVEEYIGDNDAEATVEAEVVDPGVNGDVENMEDPGMEDDDDGDVIVGGAPGDINALDNAADERSVLNNDTVRASSSTVEEGEATTDDEALRRSNPSTTQYVPKRNDVIRYKLDENAGWQECIVLSRAGKQTAKHGKNKLCVNIESSHGDVSCLNLQDVATWEKVPITANEVNLAMIPVNMHNNEACIAAKEKELQAFREFKVYEDVKDKGQDRISCMWILSEKMIDGEKGIKARLVARGFEETEEIQSDSPTCDKDSFRTFLCIAVSMNWSIECTDIKSAFLQGQLLTRNVYVEPPPEVKVPGMLWHLNKCMYGLRDAPRKWFLSVVKVLTELGCKQLTLDLAVFVYVKSGVLQGIVLLHVDDFLHVGYAVFYTDIIEKLRTTFRIGAVGKTVMSYIGLNVKQTKETIILSQTDYIEKLNAVRLSVERKMQKEQLLNEVEHGHYRKVIGQLNWVARQTRPDVVFDVMELSTKLNNPSVQDYLRAVKAVRKVQYGELNIVFPQLGDPSHWYLLVMCDAAFGNLGDSVSSAAGHIVLLVGEGQKCTPLSWKANKIKRVVRSTLAAEALSLEEAIEHAVFLRNIVQEMTGSQRKLPVEVWTDSNNTLKAVHSTTAVDDKRLRIDIACIKENMKKEGISVKWCPGNEMLANCLTKQGASSDDLMIVLTTSSIQKHFKDDRVTGYFPS